MFLLSDSSSGEGGGSCPTSVVLKLTSVMEQSGNGLTPAGEFPLHLHIEVPGLENANKAFFSFS